MPRHDCAIVPDGLASAVRTGIWRRQQPTGAEARAAADAGAAGPPHVQRAHGRCQQRRHDDVRSAVPVDAQRRDAAGSVLHGTQWQPHPEPRREQHSAGQPALSLSTRCCACAHGCCACAHEQLACVSVSRPQLQLPRGRTHCQKLSCPARLRVVL